MKLGSATVLGANQSFDGKKGNSSYNVEERALMKPEELGKIPYKDCCQDGISNTFSITPSTLGKTVDDRVNNLIQILDEV